MTYANVLRHLALLRKSAGREAPIVLSPLLSGELS